MTAATSDARSSLPTLYDRYELRAMILRTTADAIAVLVILRHY